MQTLLDYLSDSENPILRALFWVIAIMLLLISIALIGFIILLVVISIWALSSISTSTDGSFTYRKHDDHVALLSYEGQETAIVLPATFEGLPVTVFEHMTDVNGVVEEITIPDDLLCTFSSTNQKALFLNFPVLQNIHVSDNHPNLSVIDGVLYNKDGKILLIYPAGRTGEAVIPDGVEIFWPGAFRNCALSNVVLPESLHTILNYSMCDFRVMRFLQIPPGVIFISEDAFMNGNNDSRRLQLIVTQDSPAHEFALENGIPIREVLPARQEPAPGEEAPAPIADPSAAPNLSGGAASSHRPHPHRPDIRSQQEAFLWPKAWWKSATSPWISVWTATTPPT